MSAGSPVHEIGPGEGYDIDSEEYDSEDEAEQLEGDEYDRLVEEGQSLVTNRLTDWNWIFEWLMGCS